MPKKYWIVWNAGRSEGFVTNDMEDAKQALRGRFRNPSSTLGEAFYDCYDDDDRGLQAVEIDPIAKAGA